MKRILFILNLFCLFALNGQNPVQVRRVIVARPPMAVASPSPEFIIVVKTDNAGVSASNQFSFTTSSVATTSAVIDWGDGGATETWTANVNKLHTYSSSGTYTIKVTGLFRPYFSGATDKLKIISLVNWGYGCVWQTLGSAFVGCANLQGNFTDVPNLTNCVSTIGLFSGCTSFSPTSLNNWSFPAATNASAMFFGCTKFNATCENWYLPLATDLSYMFYGCSIFNQSVNTWTTPAVTTLESFFEGATLFNQPMNDFDVADVTNFKAVFRQCINFNQPLNNWNTAKATNFNQLFESTSFNQNINNWNTALVTNMAACFYRIATFNQPLSNWNVGNVTNFTSMFERNLVFNQDISSWNVSKGAIFDYMFYEAPDFNQNISTWTLKTTGTISMEGMFSTSGGAYAFDANSFNQPIGVWDMTRVTNVSYMFSLNPAFDQDIGAWNIINCTNFSNFMTGKNPSTFSATNLDAIYNGWGSKVVQSGRTITFATAKYTAAGVAGRANLTGTYSWTITDGGL